MDFYGIRTAPIVQVEAPDLLTIAVNDRRMDFLLMRSSVNRSERAIETVEIAKRIKNEENKYVYWQRLLRFPTSLLIRGM
ncbi:hypothetical protein [Anoxybacillus mongoliensis]|uniref:hypothetical protein n=1 Tax=Anoxybacillus mongoliensis TaxID=452565 RepID=UPI001FE48CDA|nr:hypothetical protein [Anoxybacillus mongoliensis]